MSLKIITKQIYEEHEEKEEELYTDYKINFLDKSILINYNNIEIIYDLEKNKVEIKRAQNDIFIKLSTENTSIYKTPYGEINLTTFGEKIRLEENPFNLKIEYKITLGDMAEYKNVIEILEL